MLAAIRQWVIKTMTGQTGVITKMPKQEIIEMNVQITAEKIMRNGINPNDLKTVGQVENVVEQIDAPKVVSADSAKGRGITGQLLGKKKAPVFDMEGNKIPDGAKIMGGKQIQPINMTVEERTGGLLKGKYESDEAIKTRLVADNKKGIAGIKINLVDDSIAKIKSMEPMDAMKEANLVAGKKGVYKNLDDNQVKKIMDDTQEHIFQDSSPLDDYATGGRVGYAGGSDMGTVSGTTRSANTGLKGGYQNTGTGPVERPGGGGGGSKPPPVIRRTGDGGVTNIKLKKPTRFNNIDNDFTKFNMKDLISYGLVNPDEEDKNIKLAEAINFGLLPGAKDKFEASFPMFYDKNSTFQGNKYTATTKGGFVDALQKGTFGLKTEDMFNKNINSLFEGVADNEIGTGITDDAKPTYVRTGTGQDYTGYIDVPKKDLGKKELGMLPEKFFVEEKADGGRIGLKAGMTKRAFMKLMGGVGATIGAAKSGIFSGFGKGAGKTVAKEVAQQTTSSMPPPYFFKLAEKIKKMGTEVTPTTDRTISKSLLSKDGKSEYILEESLTSGDTLIKKVYKEEDMITNVEIMSLKKGEDVVTKKGKPVKTPDEYEEVTETNSRVYKDNFNDPDYEDGINVDEIIKEVDDQAPPIKYASGGLAYMLGE